LEELEQMIFQMGRGTEGQDFQEREIPVQGSFWAEQE